MAREAVASAVKESQEAIVKASIAAEAATAAEREVLDVPPLEVEPPPPSPPSTSTRRNLCREIQVMSELDETTTVTIDPPPKKFTPRKKQLATKTQKSPAKKSPAKKGKK
ncbi:uncharacterized protein [Miscanthus floridulus]|uniref:uncharacterized protein n=1 Tax=Miscanthus floridulus TaxID=154761 RepID=UPI00345870D0